MLLYVLLAGAAGLLLWRRFNPSVDPGGQGFGSTDQTPTELGVAEDGSFVLVNVPPWFNEGGAQSARPFVPPPLPQPGVVQPPVSASASVSGVGVAVGCAPGRDCCDDCRNGIVEVGCAGGGRVVPVREVEMLAAGLARQIALGDEAATARAAAIFALALEQRDAQARFIAECVTRALDAYRSGVPGSPVPALVPCDLNGAMRFPPQVRDPSVGALPARRVRVAVDNPDYRPGLGRLGVWNG